LCIAFSKKDINSFSKDVKETSGEALMYAQCGEKHPKTKILRHQGGGSILEVVEDSVGGTYRLIYTVKFEEAVVRSLVFLPID
jgi:phage-related protein